MHLIIRTDGGPEIGYGHLIRSHALAEEFLNHNHEVSVATATPQPARSVFSDDIGLIELPSRGDPKPFVDWIEANSVDAVFTDSYAVDTEYQHTIRERVPLAVLQDDNRHDICADLFVNGNLYAADLEYEFVGAEACSLLGSEYALLRREVHELAQQDPPWRETPSQAIISMGGSDPANLTPTIIEAFDGFDLSVDAIVGPGYSKEQERAIRRVSEEVSAKVIVHRDPDDLIDQMFQADFAVTTASSTIYELLALGTPAISIPVVANQARVAAKLQELDIAIVLDQEQLETTLHSAIETYVVDSELRYNRQDRGRYLVDGKGSQRVRKILVNLATSQASPSAEEEVHD